MGFPDYRRDLVSESFDLRFVLDRYFHCGQSSVFVGADPNTEVDFTNAVADTLLSAFNVRVHPLQLIVCGSAHLGFSPVPDKLGKPFDSKTSDIDVAVVAPEIFDPWWSELQSTRLSPQVRSAISRDLFWGFINPALTRGLTDYGDRWWSAFGRLRTDRAAGVRGRLYRNFWSMQSYHRLAILGGRTKLLTEAGIPATDQSPD